jgi:hypothetical protein
MKDLLKSSRHSRAQTILTGFRYLSTRSIRDLPFGLKPLSEIQNTIELFPFVLSILWVYKSCYVLL